MRRIFPVILACVGLVFLVNCGGGGSSGGGGLTLADLQGTWFGYFETDLAVPSGSYTITFDDAGRVTTTLVDGSPAPARVGTFVQSGSNLFDGNIGTDIVTLMVDDSAGYLLYIWEGGEFGTLQKGNLNGIGYTSDQIIGSWSGFAYDYSSTAGDFLRESPFSAAVTSGPAYSMTGTDKDMNPFAGYFDTFDLQPYGMYQGVITGDTDLDLVGYMSLDKQFIGTYVGDISTGVWPNEFEFLLYNRQP